MSTLEERYRRLLLAYPEWYRQDRGEEMLDTLLEAAGADRLRPTARDARGLILGGLRVRARHGQRLSAAAWSGRRAVVSVAALAAACLWVWQPQARQLGQAAESVLALAVLSILVIRRERLPWSWMWLPGTIFVANALLLVFPEAEIPRIVLSILVFGALGFTIAWSLVDARLMVAAALWLAATLAAEYLQAVARYGVRHGVWLPAVIALAVSIAAAWQLRRQATL
jgi:hypothetical protein